MRVCFANLSNSIERPRGAAGTKIFPTRLSPRISWDNVFVLRAVSSSIADPPTLRVGHTTAVCSIRGFEFVNFLPKGISPTVRIKSGSSCDAIQIGCFQNLGPGRVYI